MTNYDNGAVFEREIKADLIRKGWAAVRSAGSKGTIDVIAYHFNVALFIQAKKTGVFPPKERKKLVRLAQRHNAIPMLAEKRSVLFGKRRRGVIFYHLLTIDGEKGEQFEPTDHNA